MSPDYGTYRLTYTPPAPDGNEEYPLIAIEMSTGGDANVDQMLRFYEAFLAAAGYILNGDLEVVVRPRRSVYAMTEQGSQGTDFVPFSAVSNDVISFGGFGAK